MLYRFKSNAGSEVIMVGSNGDQVLRLIGKSPAPTGIVEAADMPVAIQALERAVAAEEAAVREAQEAAAAEGRKPPALAEGVSLRQRAWPLVDLMKRAHPHGEDIVWGV